MIDVDALKEILKECNNGVLKWVSKDKLGDKKKPVNGILQFNAICTIDVQKVLAVLDKCGFSKLDF